MVNYRLASPVLNSAGIDLSQGFHELRSSQVDVLVSLAQQQGYRKPKNANGSTARYYFAALQRKKKQGE
jgi:hypothetical protein